MAIDYHSSFNSGELSPKMQGRSDLDVYRNGCSFLENFYVLPQGGVESRTGTKFIGHTNDGDGAEGDTSARMIPFIFSAEASYACEFGEGYINVWTSDTTFVAVSGTVPYTAADVGLITFDQRFDLLFLAHPDHPTQTLSRTSITPAFSIEETAFEYPPFLEENVDSASTVLVRQKDWITATDYFIGDYVFQLGAHYIALTDHTSGVFATDLAAADWAIVPDDEVIFDVNVPINLISTEDIFTNEQDGAYFRIRHPLSEAKRLTQGVLKNNNQSSDVIYVGADPLNYKITNKGSSRLGASSSILESNSQADFAGSAGNTVVFADEGIKTGTYTPTQPYVRIRKTNTKTAVTSFELNRQTNRSVIDSFLTTTDGTTEPLDVSFSNWKVVTDGTWLGAVEVERSTDAGLTWDTFVVIVDTIGLSEEANGSFPSPSKEGETTLIRVKFSRKSGNNATMEINITNQSLYTEGVLKLDTYGSATTYTATVQNKISSGGATVLWTEGAFSLRRGYARATRFHQDRLWLAGSDFDTATVYGSVTGDYYNFIAGAEDDLGIKRIIDTSEEIKWLIGKRYLFSGTSGGAIQITSADNKQNITADNIQTNPQSVFGASNIQGVLANDVIIYPQRNNLKLREMIYNWEEENFRSNDITILNDDILVSGVKELFLQKQPDQVVWCIKENGEAAILTYERQQEVVGWARVVTDGDIISGCSLPSATGEDEVWLIVKRLGKYLVERFIPRADLDWYVDSAVEFDGGACVSADSFSIGASPDYKITVNDADNTLSDGDKVRFENVTGFDWLDGKTFEVADRTASLFILKDSEGVDYINYSELGVQPTSVTVTGANVLPVDCNGVYPFDSILLGRPIYEQGNYRIRFNTEDNFWKISVISIVRDLYKNTSLDINPPSTDWEIHDAGLAPSPVLTFGYTSSITGDYCLVQNSISGLNHLEGETVQVIVDGSYVSDEVVSSGAITLDDYGNTILAGLEFNATLRTMPLEPILANRLSNSRVKSAHKVSAKFYKTIGAKIGEVGKQPNTYPAVSTNDLAGESLPLKTGETRIFISSDWEREKIIEIKQDLPYPMTILSLAIWAEVKGG